VGLAARKLFMAHHLRIPCTVAAAACCLTFALVSQGRAEGGDSWVGKRVITKKPGAQIVAGVEKDERKVVGTLTDCFHSVEMEKAGFVQVRHRGVAGWLPKEDAVTLDDAVAFFTAQIRKDDKHARAHACRARAWWEKEEYDSALKDSSDAIRLQQGVAAWHVIRGDVWLETEEYAKARADYDEAIRLDPRDAWAFIRRALLLATCSEAKYRDGKRAVESARRGCALTGWKDAYYLDVLAAAYAEAGDFEQAVRFQKRALEFPDRPEEEKAPARERLMLYKAGKPYHDE
jgi:tetratricopeptide (TPR) repeat protein